MVCLKESLRLSRMTRFYLKQKDDPHGPHIAIYVGCLPTSLSQRQYEHILLELVGKGLCDITSSFAFIYIYCAIQ
jgi:hypothetical protein